MTRTDIDAGRLIVLVGLAPLKPGEFVVIRIRGAGQYYRLTCDDRGQPTR
jgi:phage tail sheath protein FI